MSWSAFTTGFALCATLIIAIGAQNAFVLRQGIRKEHVAPVVLFCALADLVLIGAGVAGLGRVLGDTPRLVGALTTCGSAFLVWYGVRALRRALEPQALQAAAGTKQLSLGDAIAQAAGFTLLNPHVYLDTVLLMGSIGTRQPPQLRAWFVGGAACASGMWFTALGFGARLLAPIFARPRAWQVLDTVVGLTMLALACALISRGAAGLP
jgi:L-lysine exporter family protein LysE/ArgO